MGSSRWGEKVISGTQMTEHAHALLNLSAAQLLVRSLYEVGWWGFREGRLLLTEDSLIFAVCFMFPGHISMCCEGIRYYLYALVGPHLR